MQFIGNWTNATRNVPNRSQLTRPLLLSIAASLLAIGCGQPSAHDATAMANRHTLQGPISRDADGHLDVVCTVFPIYLFTKAVVGDAPGVRVSLMLPAEMGCPHDYDLTPADVKKIAGADLLIMNGAGLEEFSLAQIDAANREVDVIDASKDLLAISLSGHDHDEAEHDHDDHAHDDHDHASHDHGDHDHPSPATKVAHDDHEHADHHHDEHDHAHHGHDHHDHGHSHEGGKNPHFFSSPAHAAEQVQEIAEALIIADPQNKDAYQKNAGVVVEKLKGLAQSYRDLSTSLDNKRFVTVHEVFDYLAKDNGWEIADTIFATPGQEPSAKETRELIEKIRAVKPAAILTEPQYSAKSAEAIAAEAKVPVISLDPVASGPADATIDYYFVVMQKNLAALQQSLKQSEPVGKQASN